MGNQKQDLLILQPHNHYGSYLKSDNHLKYQFKFAVGDGEVIEFRDLRREYARTTDVIDRKMLAEQLRFVHHVKLVRNWLVVDT